jgi:hypothetical protein
MLQPFVSRPEFKSQMGSELLGRGLIALGRCKNQFKAISALLVVAVVTLRLLLAP